MEEILASHQSPLVEEAVVVRIGGHHTHRRVVRAVPHQEATPTQRGPLEIREIQTG